MIFDFGHTIMDEVQGRDAPLLTRPIHPMPGLPVILACIKLKMGIWANTKTAGADELWFWLRRARIDGYFERVVTSVDAGARKPDRRFFSYALKACQLKKSEVIFVGNQLNTDIQGAKDSGIAPVWLTGRAYHSPHDITEDVGVRLPQPAHTIRSLRQLPALLKTLT